MAANPGVPEATLKLDTERTPTKTIVHCTGKVTAETATLFQDTIRGLIPEAKCIEVDLAHVTHLDSAGLGALVGVWSSARRKSAEVGFRWPEPHGAAAPYEVKLVHFLTTTYESCFASPGWINCSAFPTSYLTMSADVDQHCGS